MARDGEAHKDDDPEAQDRLRPGPGRLAMIFREQERVGLLADHEHNSGDADEGGYGGALDDIANQPSVRWPTRMRPLEKPMKTVWSNMSPPLISTIIDQLIGVTTPALHQLILNKEGALYTYFTQSIANLGELLVVLQTFIIGAEFALMKSSHPGVLATSWVLLVRFILMPAAGILFVLATTGCPGLYVNDRLVWFLLVLIPAGPSAMLLMSAAELVNVSQGVIAGYLTIAVFLPLSTLIGKYSGCHLQYMISPLIAVMCSLGFEVVLIAAKRVFGL